MKAKAQIPSVHELADASPLNRGHKDEPPHGSEDDKWLDSLEYLLGDVLKRRGSKQVNFLLERLIDRLKVEQNREPSTINTPYVNSIPVEEEPRYPGDRQIERKMKSYARWNAMAMVVKANRVQPGIGGHISTYASSANLYEVGFNHFFRGGEGDGLGDLVYFQGHASPGNYARAYLEHRLSARKLHHFRQELAKGGGLSSYPHPYLMPDFWQFPSVSMGLAPIMSIYQARFGRYLKARGFIDQDPHVWCFVGDGEITESYARWNAMAMVVKANRVQPGIGGHISTYASSANLYEVGFNHFFRGGEGDGLGDLVYFQGHASPGNYARAYLEHRLSARKLHHFRQELAKGGGLSSYPHPYLMPDFWQFPSVSMGLAPIMSIYQARFGRYHKARGFIDQEPHVWCFVGDGEIDEPESTGALSIAARENLDNLTWVVNCNLQRLDGPVRGNGKIIQELEAVFRGAGWNVIKVIWGSDWDPLLAADEKGLLVERMEQAVDGDYQKYSVAPGSYTRKHFFGTHPELLEMVNHLTDDEIQKLTRGGHDPQKVYAAYAAAQRHQGAPTVILAKTVKGYGLGEAGEGRNITHQQKQLNERELRSFRSRFGVPLSDEEVVETPFYRPPLNSPETTYLLERRKSLGGFLPARINKAKPLALPEAPLRPTQLPSGTKGPQRLF